SSIAGVALGLAIAGKRPVAEMQFTDFAHMAFNSITNEIAKYRYRSDGDWSVPLVVRAPMGGHAHGALYHSQSIEARFATPGLKIVIPSTPYEAKGLLLAAIRDADPVLFFEHKRLYRMFKEAVPKGEYLIPLKVARTAREGTDISVFCYGLMVHYALEAAKTVEAEGVSVEIVDLRTVYPLDKGAILTSARKTGKCLVLYEDNFSVSIGSEVAAIIADEAWRWLDAPVKRLGGLDVPSMPYAPAMEDAFMPNPVKIARALRELGATAGEAADGRDGKVTATPEAPAPAPRVEAPKPAARAEAKPAAAPPPPPELEGGEHRYSPAVQMLASELKVDLSQIHGTGL